IAFLSELFDRVAPVSENPPITVEIRDRTGCRTGIRIAFIQRDVAGLLEQFRDVDRPIVFGADMHGHRERFIADFEGCNFVGHEDSLL
ncbi:MAG: hypothetical protein RLZZ396_2505, partial [Planctomycetota bacterium]